MAPQTPQSLSLAVCATLGLHRDPFADQDDLGFVFADAAHKTQINVALQLLQASERLLIVRGEYGIGKSAFLLGLGQRRTEGLRFSHIAATADATLEQLLAQFLSEVELVRADEAFSVPLAAARLTDSARSGERAVLLLDDAGKLDDEVIARLLSLRADTVADGAPFGLVLAVEPGFDARLEELKAGTLSSEQLHVINLYPYSEKQSADYLTQRLALAGDGAGVNLTEAQKREIHIRSKGVPAALNAEARRVLAERAAKLAPPAQPARGGKRGAGRLLYAGVAAAVLALVGGLLVAVSGLEEDTAPVQAAASEPVPMKPGTPYGLSVPPQYGFDKPEAAAPGLPAPAARETAAEAESAPAEAPLAPAESTAAAGAEADPAQTQPPALAPPVLQPAASAASVAADPTQSKTAVSAAAAPTPGVAAAAPATAEAAPSTPRPAPEPGPAEPAPRDGNDWLRARKAGHYTIQLIGARDRTMLERYLVEHELAARAMLIRTEREGADWFVVVLGDYASFSSAKGGLAKLPPKLRASGAFPKKFAALQGAVRP